MKKQLQGSGEFEKLKLHWAGETRGEKSNERGRDKKKTQTLSHEWKMSQQQTAQRSFLIPGVLK